MNRLIFLTGRPGVGKTSVLIRAIDLLKVKRYKIGGMISREFREHKVRVGFEIVDFGSGRKGWLAHINQPTGPRVGKYRVNLRDLKTIGVSSLYKAMEEADIIVVDEIGPMELFSPEFKEIIMRGINSKKPLIGTIHSQAYDSLINAIKARKDAKILEVTPINRAYLHTILVDEIHKYIQSQS